MWELTKALPFGRLSIRNFWMFAAAVTAATFLYMLVASPTVRAADAEWNGDSIMYQGNEYQKIDVAKAGDSHGLMPETVIYRYVAPSTSNPGTPTTKAHLIFFAPGVDPPTATSAEYAVYDYTPPNTYANPTAKTSISITEKSATSEGTTSCDSTFTFGIGWIVCPVTNFLASAMDHLFDILANFLTVRPVQTNQENALYRAWSYMRNFANVAFVIAFLIIIYSQLTSIGLSNYDIKKMLPRLVVAAILVNISYWICAIAIDISNIAGWSIQDIFISIRNSLVGTEGNNWDVLSWKSIAGVILSGGTAAAAAGLGAYGLLLSAGTVGGALYMLLPILVGVIVAVLVALLIMAARQAIITILLIVSPLAFVAYLLPNTQKYFEKWQQLGMTMLLLFPIFSVVFGGSQLAGMAIIQNADSINLIILGMGVQVAPVVITPLLVRFSGSLLARIGGIVNNPGKGLIDRTRKFAEERRDQHKARTFAQPLNRRRDAIARLGRNVDTNRRNRQGWQKANEAMVDAQWANTNNAHKIHAASEEAKMLEHTGEAVAQAAFEKMRTTSGSRIQVGDVNLRVAKLDVSVAEARANAQWENLRAAESPLNKTPDHLVAQARDAREHTLGASVVARQIHAAQHEQQQDFAQLMQSDSERRKDAGGISSHGADSALAAAIAAKREAYGKQVNEARQIIKQFNLSGAERQQLAMGTADVVVRDDNNNVVTTLKSDSVHAREAAIEAQMSGEGSFENIQQIITNSGGSLDYFKTTIGDEMAKNKIADKAAYLGGITINDVKQGKIKDDTTLNIAVARTIASGKIKPIHLATNEVDAVRRVLAVAKSGNTAGLSAEHAASLASQISQLGASAKDALTNPALSGSVAQNVKPILEEIAREWPTK